MATRQPLSDDDKVVLHALMTATSSAETTDAAIAATTGLGDKLLPVLRELESRDPPLVVSAVDEGLERRIWIATDAGGAAMDRDRWGA